MKDENPDALFIDMQTPAVAERIFKQAQELGWKPQLLVNDVIAGNPELLQKNTAFVEGALTAEFLPKETDPKFQAFTAAYRTKYNEDSPYQNYMASVYDLVYILADGIQKVGYDGTKLADWSRTVKDWPGASGSVTIGKDGDRVGGHALEVIRNGKKEPVK